MRIATLAALALMPHLAFAQGLHTAADSGASGGVPIAGEQSPRSSAESALTELDAESAERVNLVRELARHRGGQPAALAQVIQLSAGLGDAVVAELLAELAEAHARAGNIDLAAETRLHLAQRYPDQPRANQSILWLVEIYASSELAHARRETSQGVEDLKRQLSPAMRAALESAPATVAPSGGTAGAAPPAEPGDSSAAYAMRLATEAMARQPALSGDPALAFQRAVAARRAGHKQAAQALLTPLKHRAANDPWGRRARMEAWLQERPPENPPLELALCHAAEQPPHLDGRLDEPMWQFAKARTLIRSVVVPTAASISSPPAGQQGQGTLLRFARDAEYFYLAVDSPKLPDGAYLRDNHPRPRDGDVDGHDHVRLKLDLDRDYATWYELVVDSRGWTSERCVGDLSWNPQWYVAAADSPAGDRWIVEAAIPLSELSSDDPQSFTSWACEIHQAGPGGVASHWDGVLVLQ